MENDDIYNFLFEQKVNESLFDMEDTELSEQKNKAKDSQKELMSFIETMLDPADKEELLQLLEKRDDDYQECFHLEHRLFYRNGIKDGISIIVTAIAHK